MISSGGAKTAEGQLAGVSLLRGEASTLKINPYYQAPAHGLIQGRA